MTDKISFSLFKIMILVSAGMSVIALPFFLIGVNTGVSVLSGVLLSAIFVSSNAWIFDRFFTSGEKLFFRVYFFSVAFRFILVIGVMIILIETTKIDQIYFTVSFIISYLCQSVTEMIFLNKLLETQQL